MSTGELVERGYHFSINRGHELALHVRDNWKEIAAYAVVTGVARFAITSGLSPIGLESWQQTMIAGAGAGFFVGMLRETFNRNGATENRDIIADMTASMVRVAGLRPSGESKTLHTGRLVPIYPETQGLSSKWLRGKIASILPQVTNQLDDFLPDSIKKDMVSLNEAIHQIHLPENYEQVEKSRERLGFDELFLTSLATQKARLEWQQKDLIEPLKIDQAKLEEFISKLPFKLTKAQDRVLKEIISDLNRTTAMNRLLQGEVGSGKTVVAAIALYLIHLNKLKTLFMAPTEILAFQHHQTLSKLLEPFSINVGIYTGSRKKAKEADVIVGTHALLSEKLNASDVGLVVIDEQQRFGVEQRTLLRSKAKVPHFLTMTATPIPRTVALTLYGDLDLSIIDELPKGRQTIKTHLAPLIII